MTEFQDVERRRRGARSSYQDVKKHFVRLDGWLPIFRKYSAIRGNGDVRYFTLCAKHAIDVRYFRHKGFLSYDEAQKTYPTVSFIEKDSQDYATIAESLGTTKLALKGDLEEILLDPLSNRDASSLLDGSFPYDVVNLDFTGEVVRAKDAPYSRTVRAIERIVDLQHRSHAQDWHMFLTFRACQETANHEADNELRDILEGNLKTAEPRAAYGERAKPDELLRADYAEFLRLSVTKFLAASASHKGYACALESSYTYPRKPAAGPAYEIVKLIVGFRAIRGAHNLPNPHHAHEAYQQTVPRIFRSRAVDVSAKLENAELRQRVERDLAPILRELESQNIVD